ncbi:tagaturonate reductase [Lewinella sp. LCG006]|uniref:tagaturonate reductase n=1 Tax=Lewinella sp. LCG006 TaxID=3231911 RepID=UPI003461451D
MMKLNRTTAKVNPAPPARILQFGGGNFLRGFADWIIDVYNEKSADPMGVLVVKPTKRGDYQAWREQDGLYHVLTKGIRDGELMDEKHLVKCVGDIIHPYHNWEAFLSSAENKDLRFILSNTTETGIRFSAADQWKDEPPAEFPAKLTRWLYHRYQHFKGDPGMGCVLIPTELLVDNGAELKATILQYVDAWNLDAGFKTWLEEANTFCNTLVDRIVPGVGKEEMAAALAQVSFEDEMITQGEPYHFWGIEAPLAVREEWPLDKIGLNIIYTDDLTPYRTSKVRILNGAHTAMVPVGYLYGLTTVRETVEHPIMGAFVEKVIFDEIMPTLDMKEEELKKFATAVLDRFKNPFIHHQLISIALNSVSKFKTRLLPSLLEYSQRKGDLPEGIVLSLAALIRFYKGVYDGKTIPVNDEAWATSFLAAAWDENDGSAEGTATLVRKVLSWEEAWGEDLSTVPGLQNMLTTYLSEMDQGGIAQIVKRISA